MLKNVFVTTAAGMLFLLVVVAGTVKSEDNTFKVVGSALKLFEECSAEDFTVCLKEKAFKWISSLHDDYEIFEGVRFVRSSDHSRSISDSEEVDTKLPTNLEEKSEVLDTLIVDRIAKFLESHTLQFKIPESTIGEMRSSFEERGKKKRRRLLLPLLLLLKLKAAVLIPLALGGLALLAFKALIVGKLALLISGIIGLKKLLDSKQSTQSYEVVAHPHVAHSNTYDDHGHAYGRSFSPKMDASAAAQDIVYKAYVPKQL